MVNGSGKQFAVVDNPYDNSAFLKTYVYQDTPEQENADKAVGGEMKSLASGNKTANPAAHKLTLNGTEINSVLYALDNVILVGENII